MNPPTRDGAHETNAQLLLVGPTVVGDSRYPQLRPGPMRQRASSADGRAVRQLPYRARRQLLDELALEGPGRTPRCFVGLIAELTEVTVSHGLEGVVAKRVDAPYVPGRRSTAWIKTKHRRREYLAVTGLREPTNTRPAELLVARRRPDGTLAPAGAATIGAETELLDTLDLAPMGRRGIRAVRTPIAVAVDCHGRPDGPVRDAIVRGFASAKR
ncbi:MAG TPA: hypothetical protein VGJ70_04595 [Solirubrobacteraceae bacterium]|jgi:hypothetical protein